VGVRPGRGRAAVGRRVVGRCRETLDAHATACLAGLFTWVDERDDARAAALFEVGLTPLRGVATAGPTAWWGVWALLRTIEGRDGGAALGEVRDSNVIVPGGQRRCRRVRRGAGRRPRRRPYGAADALARGDAATAGMPYSRHLLRSVLARAAAGVELGDPAGWVREALAFVEPRATCASPARAGSCCASSACRYPGSGTGPPTCRRGCGRSV
jgi:hypothetical protein